MSTKIIAGFGFVYVKLLRKSVGAAKPTDYLSEKQEHEVLSNDPEHNS